MINNSLQFLMPQTVPSAGFSPPCDYTNFAADSFDLSLLPSDSEVPYSPTNLQQLMSLYCDPTGSPPPMFPEFLDDLQVLKTMSQQKPNAPDQQFPPYQQQQQQQQHQVKEEPMYLLHQGYPAPPYTQPSSPAGSTASSSYTNNPSPYQQCPSPSLSHPMIKHEQIIDLQEILQESRILQESLGNGRTLEPKKEPQKLTGQDCSVVTSLTVPTPVVPALSPMASTSSSSSVMPPPSPAERSTPDKPSAERKPGDHILLREVLRDMSFQRKYNLKPFDFDALTATGFLAGTETRVKTEVEEGASCSVAKGEEGSTLMSIEPVLSLAIEQIRVDINNTCNVLGIASDLTQWTVDDVKAWLLWTLRQYNLPMIRMEYFNMDGVALSALSEEEFQKRAPECGSTLYARLEIWKAACTEMESQPEMSGPPQWSSSNNSSGSSGEVSDEEDEEEPEPTASSSSTSSAGGKAPSSRSAGSGGSHIHLWQFLKELLSSPQLHGSCIRWLDRSKGVFKIEDSVRVARLWGKRKNRPAMNYDKLSRSIRQYYKKGIMKKTERSQRLVYQFCHPYCL
ncbi:DNA-binding protein D-ETS-4 isoform X2 [Periplaneta americana]|uniref:DNA-binding protein D-ETS-4 isoform X2 n=1 Tax=Periplaneta americana TaxID=6978 RepID=UPI0037E92F71